MLGGLYGVAQILQTAGLAHTPASVSGFITGMYVVATPLFAALLLRTRIGGDDLGRRGAGDGGARRAHPGRRLSIGYGEALIFVAAMIYALHIVGLGAWSNAQQALGMSIVQLIVIAVICLGRHAPERDRAPRPGRRLAAILYMAVFAGAAAR